MTDLKAAVQSGYYARTQILNKARLIAWSHQSRFAMGLEIARHIGGSCILDYGCGDGTFLGMLADGDDAPRLAVGAELYPKIVDDCCRRFAGHDGLQFKLIPELQRPEEHGRYDAIYCMEVFEHVVSPVPLLDHFNRLLAPGGALIISVPIETGLPVVVKQVVRRIAGWRGIGHYPGTTGYTAGELVKSIFAGAHQHVPRPVFTGPEGATFHDHKAFNWRVLRGLIRARFDLVRESTSPVAWLGPQFGTQRWFIARKRAAQ